MGQEKLDEELEKIKNAVIEMCVKDLKVKVKFKDEIYKFGY